MIRALVAGTILTLSAATAATSAITDQLGAPTPKAGEKPAALELAQGPVILPPSARCQRSSPPSHRRETNPYVIWTCRRNNSTQFDYYLGQGYVYSLIVPQ